MAEPLLTELFGTGATQTDTTLTISKAALTAKGLTATANNSAESLFVALFLMWKDTLTEDRQTTNPDQSITITDGLTPQSLVTRNNQTYRQNQFSINLQKLDTQSGIDPDDY